MNATLKTAVRATAFTRGPARRFSVSVRAAEGHINPAIKKDVDKVVDMVKTDDLPKKAVFCRCWRSATFPMCDGKHAVHNKETGDNVGPLIVEKSS